MFLNKQENLDLIKVAMKGELKPVAISVENDMVVFRAGSSQIYTEFAIKATKKVSIPKPIVIAGDVFVGLLPYLDNVEISLKAKEDYLLLESNNFSYKLEYIDSTVSEVEFNDLKGLKVGEVFFKAIDFARNFVQAKKDASIASMVEIRDNSVISYNGKMFSLSYAKGVPDFKTMYVDEVLSFLSRYEHMLLDETDKHYVFTSEDRGVKLALAKPIDSFPDFSEKLEEIKGSISTEVLLDRENLKDEVSKALLILGSSRDSSSEIKFEANKLKVVNEYTSFDIPVKYSKKLDETPVSLPISLFKEILPAFPFVNIELKFAPGIIFINFKDEEINYNVVVTIQG